MRTRALLERGCVLELRFLSRSRVTYSRDVWRTLNYRFLSNLIARVQFLFLDKNIKKNISLLWTDSYIFVRDSKDFKFLFLQLFPITYLDYTWILLWTTSMSVIGHIVSWFYVILSRILSTFDEPRHEVVCTCAKHVGRSLHVRIVCGTVRVIGKEFCNKETYVQALLLGCFRLLKVQIQFTIHIFRN